MRKYKINKKERSAWLKALRSGKYSQCEGELNKKGTNSFCCLGVYGKVVGIEDFEGQGLPMSLSDEKRKKYPKCLLGSYDNKSFNRLSFAGKLAEMNDEHKKSFKQIATYIQKNTIGV